MYLPTNPVHIKCKMVSTLNPRRWIFFLLCWLIIAASAFLVEDLYFGTVRRVVPALGWAQVDIFGCIVRKVKEDHNQLRISFIPKSENPSLFGGVLLRNLFCIETHERHTLRYLGMLSAQPLDNAQNVTLTVKGKHGGERFELKLRNQEGEGWIVVGDKPYTITTEFREFTIPISAFESTNRTAGGSAFRRENGLSGIIIAANNHLLSDSCTEITISSLEIGDARRSDRLLGLSLIIILFVISVLVKFNSILRTQFHVFISYSREDKEQAGALASRLNDYGLSCLA